MTPRLRVWSSSENTETDRMSGKGDDLKQSRMKRSARKVGKQTNKPAELTERWDKLRRYNSFAASPVQGDHL